jgi:hypothetical protein
LETDVFLAGCAHPARIINRRRKPQKVNLCIRIQFQKFKVVIGKQASFSGLVYQ